ncbi:hypothetical protein P4571_07830 [Niallia alba]|uniref:hypothetical protein n=1 Tax=Niallia alba TaxID=2729105 RepID=UPI002E1A9862|nr:hypothetical protein [Niallia alba]
MDSKIKRYSLEEVLEYVEYKLSNDINTYDEEILYQEYKWQGVIDKNVHKVTLKKLIREMRKEYGF